MVLTITIHHDSGTDTLTPLKTEEHYFFNKLNFSKMFVRRSEANNVTLNERDDEIELHDGATTYFRGPLRNVERRGVNLLLLVDSHERYAKDAKPSGAVLSYDGVADTNIVNDAVSDIPEVSTSTVNNVKSGLTFEFQFETPSTRIRRVRRATAGEVFYNPDGTLDYLSVGSLGADKTGTTLSPANQNIVNFDKLSTAEANQFTHVRVVGQGRGDDQVFADVTAPSYSSGREIWAVVSARNVGNQSTLTEIGNEWIAEKENSVTRYRIFVEGETVNLGDEFTINYPEENISNETLRVGEVIVHRDSEGPVFEAEFTNAILTEEKTDEKVLEELQQFERTDTTQTNIENFPTASGVAGQVPISQGNNNLAMDFIGRPIYGDATSGSITRSSNGNENGLIRCDDYTLTSGTTRTVSQGILIIVARDFITIEGTFDAKGRGGAGGDGDTDSDGFDGSDGASAVFRPHGAGGAGGAGDGGGQPGYNGGDGDQNFIKRSELITTGLLPTLDIIPPGNAGAGGGGGGGGDAGTANFGNGFDGSFPGGGGGGGSTNSGGNNEGGNGGNGGGMVLLVAPTITFNGTVDIRGNDGEDKASTSDHGGAGGGGTGGFFAMITQNLTDNGTTQLAGGTGGVTGADTDGRGGDGADGASGQKVVNSFP